MRRRPRGRRRAIRPVSSRCSSAPSSLDEVQRAPGPFLAIKLAADSSRKPGSFLLTGSANVLLVPPITRIEVVLNWTQELERCVTLPESRQEAGREKDVSSRRPPEARVHLKKPFDKRRWMIRRAAKSVSSDSSTTLTMVRNRTICS